MSDKQRTNRQSRALHLYFEQLADELNLSGLDMKAVLKPEVDIPWTKDSVRDHLFKPLMKAYLDKNSTTELTTDEVSKVYDALNRHLSDKFGISIEFPSWQSLISQKNDEYR